MKKINVAKGIQLLKMTALSWSLSSDHFSDDAAGMKGLKNKKKVKACWAETRPFPSLSFALLTDFNCHHQVAFANKIKVVSEASSASRPVCIFDLLIRPW